MAYLLDDGARLVSYVREVWKPELEILVAGVTTDVIPLSFDRTLYAYPRPDERPAL
jgi:hypothetical protein